MTATALAPVPTATVRSVGSPGAVEDLRGSVRSLGVCLAEVSPTDSRWQTVGPSVGVVVDLVRQSVGSAGTAVSGDLAPIVLLRDFAVAARVLLGREVTVVDPEAARDAQVGCVRIVMALA